MEAILLTIFIVLIIAAIVVAAWYLLPVIVVVGLIIWIVNKFRQKKQPTEIPDNPYEEIFGNQSTNPFESEYTQSRQNVPDVIDVEYTVHEDDSNDQA